MNILPKEIIVKIAKELPSDKDVNSLSETCKRIHLIIKEYFLKYTIICHQHSRHIIMIIQSEHPSYKNIFESKGDNSFTYHTFISSEHNNILHHLCQMKFRITHRETDRKYGVIVSIEEYKKGMKNITITEGNINKIVNHKTSIINWFDNCINNNIFDTMRNYNIQMYDEKCDADNNPKDYDDFLKQFKNNIIPEHYVENEINHYFWDIDANNTYMNTYTSSFFLPGFKGLRTIADGYKNVFLVSKDEREYFYPKPENESFLTHDNGGNPFLVYKNNNSHAIILKMPISEDKDEEFYELSNDKLKLLYTEIVVEYKNVKRFMPGKCNEQMNTGNSVLLELNDGRYIHIGINIYSFTLPENEYIIEYYSLIGNNDVPYPVAVGNINAYFMLDCIFINKTHFPEDIDWEDAYMFFYGHRGGPLPNNDRYMKGNEFENMKYIHYRD